MHEDDREITKEQLLVNLAEAEAIARHTAGAITSQAATHLEDIRDAIQRLQPVAVASQPIRVPAPPGDHSAGGAAPREGFASARYSAIYQDYARLIEATMHAERVPAAYRRVIRRYFDNRGMPGSTRWRSHGRRRSAVVVGFRAARSPARRRSRLARKPSSSPS